jgi:hypothetical protein
LVLDVMVEVLYLREVFSMVLILRALSREGISLD